MSPMMYFILVVRRLERLTPTPLVPVMVFAFSRMQKYSGRAVFGRRTTGVAM